MPDKNKISTDLFAMPALIIRNQTTHKTGLTVSFKPGDKHTMLLKLEADRSNQEPCLWVSRDVMRGQLSHSGLSLGKTREHTIPYYHAGSATKKTGEQKYV